MAPQPLQKSMSSVLEQFCHQIEEGTQDGGKINVQNATINKLDRLLETYRSLSVSIERSVTDQILSVLEHDTNSICRTLSPSVYHVVLRFILQSEHSRNRERVAYLLAAALFDPASSTEAHAPQIFTDNERLEIAKAVLVISINFCLCTEQPKELRRWIGLICVQLMGTSRATRGVFDCSSEDLRCSLGPHLLSESDEILRTILGHFISNLTQAGIALQHLWPRNAQQIHYEKFPCGVRDGEWKKKFQEYIENSWTPTEQDYGQLYFAHLVQLFPDYNMSQASFISDVVLDSERFTIFTSATTTIFDRTLEIPFCLVERLSVAGIATNSDFVQLRLDLRTCADDTCYLNAVAVDLMAISLTLTRSSTRDIVDEICGHFPELKYNVVADAVHEVSEHKDVQVLLREFGQYTTTERVRQALEQCDGDLNRAATFLSQEQESLSRGLGHLTSCESLIFNVECGNAIQTNTALAEKRIEARNQELTSQEVLVLNDQNGLIEVNPNLIENTIFEVTSEKTRNLSNLEPQDICDQASDSLSSLSTPKSLSPFEFDIDPRAVSLGSDAARSPLSRQRCEEESKVDPQESRNVMAKLYAMPEDDLGDVLTEVSTPVSLGSRKLGANTQAISTQAPRKQSNVLQIASEDVSASMIDETRLSSPPIPMPPPVMKPLPKVTPWSQASTYKVKAKKPLSVSRPLESPNILCLSNHQVTASNLTAKVFEGPIEIDSIRKNVDKISKLRDVAYTKSSDQKSIDWDIPREEHGESLHPFKIERQTPSNNAVKADTTAKKMKSRILPKSQIAKKRRSSPNLDSTRETRNRKKIRELEEVGIGNLETKTTPSLDDQYQNAAAAGDIKTLAKVRKVKGVRKFGDSDESMDGPGARSTILSKDCAPMTEIMSENRIIDSIDLHRVSRELLSPKSTLLALNKPATVAAKANTASKMAALLDHIDTGGRRAKIEISDPRSKLLCGDSIAQIQPTMAQSLLKAKTLQLDTLDISSHQIIPATQPASMRSGKPGILAETAASICETAAETVCEMIPPRQPSIDKSTPSHSHTKDQKLGGKKRKAPIDNYVIPKRRKPSPVKGHDNMKPLLRRSPHIAVKAQAEQRANQESKRDPATPECQSSRSAQSAGIESLHLNRGIAVENLLDDHLIRKPAIIDFNAKGPLNQGFPSAMKLCENKHSRQANLTVTPIQSNRQRRKRVADYGGDDSGPILLRKQRSVSPTECVPLGEHGDDEKMIAQSVAPFHTVIASGPQVPRVDENGSPLAPGRGVVNHIERLKGRLMDTRRYDSVWDGKQRLSSIKKALPAAPEDIVPRYVPHTKTRQGSYEAVKDRDIVQPQQSIPDPFIESCNSGNNTFMDRLRAEPGSHTPHIMRSRGNPASQRLFADQTTLVDVEDEALGTNSIKMTTGSSALSQGSVPSRQPLSESHRWNMALKPHYNSLQDGIEKCAKEILIRLEDKDNALELLAQQYDEGASRIVDTMIQKHRIEKEEMRARLVGKQQKMRDAYHSAITQVSQTLEQLKLNSMSQVEEQWRKEQVDIEKLIQEGIRNMDGAT